MSLNFPTLGLNAALEMLGNKTPAQDLVMKLYTNNVTPGPNDVAATYTEASGFGYAPVSLSGVLWGSAAFGSISFAQQVFTFTGALGNVYGYFIVQTSSGTLVYSERFSDGPYAIANNGDKIEITPTIQARTS